MRVFVTGATGFIGSTVVRELLTAGHEVFGLARNDEGADKLARAGAEAHRGDLVDVASLVAGAQACDSVIHMAFIHDFSQYAASVEVDRRAVEAMTMALEGSDKPFVMTSGTALLAHGRIVTEEEAPSPDNPAGARAVSEQIALTAAERGVRAGIVRLPPTVHGRDDHGFVPALIDIARRTGVSAFVGDGANRWPAVHRLDAARLFRLGLEKATPGTRLHGVAEEGIPMRAIAETIGQGLGVPVRGVTEDEAPSHFGWLAGFVAIDNPTSSDLTRESMGWSPPEAGLLADMRDSGYFS